MSDVIEVQTPSRVVEVGSPSYVVEVAFPEAAPNVDWSTITNKPETFPAGGSAGGVLSGTYPNPGFAVPMATSEALTLGLAGKADLVDGKVPSVQLPSYVDDVLEYPTLEDFPETGESGKIYIATNAAITPPGNVAKTYRWAVTTYAEIVASPGSTDAVPEGVVNLYYTNARASAAAPVQSVAGRTGAITLAISDITNLQAELDNPTPNSIQFDLAPTGTAAVGRLAWNPDDSTLNLPLNADVTLQIGQEVLVLVVNKSGEAITNGKACIIAGAQGQRMKAALASNSDNTAHQTIGVATQDILNNATGFVCVHGLVRGLNLSSYEDGDQLWLATSGDYTKTQPAAPAHAVRVGTVVNAGNGASGSLFVHVEAGSDLAGLHDVLVTGATNNQVLYFDQTTGIWKPKTLAKADVGLGNVDNTADANKPVSTAQAAAISAAQSAAIAGAPVQSVAGRTGAVTLAKSDVGLGNVDNTADANKPVSTAQAAAIASATDMQDIWALGGL